MSTYGYERLTDLTREDIESRMHEVFNRKDASGLPAPATVEDLRTLVDVLLDTMAQLDNWVVRNAAR